MMKDNPSKIKYVYEKIKEIGSGSFGVAYLVRCIQNKNLYVIKSINLMIYDKQEKDKALTEAKILNRLDHPNIIKFHEVFIANKPTCTLNIITEYAEEGDLAKRIENHKKQKIPFKESQILEWIIQISLALNEIHTKKIIHRDIKPANCFLSNDDMIKLGDFGISKPLSYTLELAKTKTGTPYYMAPEIKSNLSYSNKCDIWSLGILLYELMTFTQPFESGTLKEIKQTLHKVVTSQVLNKYSEGLRKLLKELLTYEPEKRPSAYDILTKDVCKNQINALFMEITTDQNKTNNEEQDKKEEPKLIKIKQIKLDQNQKKPASSKQVTQVSGKTSAPVVKKKTTYGSEETGIVSNDKTKDTYSNSVKDVKPISQKEEESAINHSNTGDLKTKAHLHMGEDLKYNKNNLLNTNRNPIDCNNLEKYDNLQKSVETKNNHKHCPQIVKCNTNGKENQNAKEKEKPTLRNNDDNDKDKNVNNESIITSPYDPNEKNNYHNSYSLFNSFYTVVNNQEIKETEQIQNNNDTDLNTPLQTEENHYIGDLTESLIFLEQSKQELMLELGEMLFNVAYNIISDNYISNTFNFVAVKKILKTQLKSIGFEEYDISSVMYRFTGIFFIVSNEKERLMK